MLDFLFFCFFGVFIGALAGLLPGLHPNQLYFLLFSLSFALEPDSFIVFVASLATSNLAFSYIPTLFLSLPDANTVANILPAHKLVLKGRGFEALTISLISLLLVSIIIFALLPTFYIVLPFVQKTTKPFVHVFLFTLVLIMIFTEKGIGRVYAALLFLISGVLGLVTLNSKFLSYDKVLFCVLTGLFGLPGLIFSSKGLMPKQDTREASVKINFKSIVLGILGGLVSGVLPGAGESQVGLLLSLISKADDESILSSLASINMANMLLAVLMLVTTNKIRSGLAECLAVTEIKEYILLFFGAVLFSVGVSSIFCFFFAKSFLAFIEKIDYKKLSRAIIFVITIMVILFTGLWGLFLVFISTALGILPILLNVKRTSNMGFLILPTLLFYSQVNLFVF
ncbi:MAG: tripartite tricarboxylate transporter permease [Candidatus Aenigmarchaeota archaeon]|nr:tripartite tricarboxylate transporter permease [Candidatus Aenigmarchaeota archaeon]